MDDDIHKLVESVRDKKYKSFDLYFQTAMQNRISELLEDKKRGLLDNIFEEKIVKTSEVNGHDHKFDADQQSGRTSTDDGHDHSYKIGDKVTGKGGDDDHVHELPEIKIDEALKKRIKRIRGGKLQKKFVTTRKGFKIKDGKAIKQSAAERRKRKRGAKKASRRRRGKIATILRKRKRSLLKRKSRGLD